MGAEIDRLEIQVEAQATKANNQLDKLVIKLDRVSNALSGLNSHGLSGLSDSVSKFAQASAQLSNVKTADFTRLTKNIGKLATLNTQQIYGASSAMHTLATAMNSLGNSSKNSTQVTQLASAISQLGSANAKKAAANLPALATAMDGFMTTMAKAPQVSNNVINMTNALAKLASQGAKVGTAGNSLTASINRIGTSMEKTTKKARSFSSVIGSVYQKYFWVMRAGNKLWDSVKQSMNYVEVLNYFDAAFGQVADSAVSQWETSGENSAEAYYNSFSDRAKQLTTKMTGFIIADSDMLQSTGGKSLGINPSQLMNYQAMFVQMSNSMGITAETSLKVSTALTEIGADLASVKNMNFDKVWTDMASGLAGMSRTLDKYGANIRNVNLQQKLTELGINANITALNQNEKALLRTIILLDSTRYAWGDLGETINQPANQLRLLESNFANLARTVGNIFLPIVAKVLPYLNSVVIALQRLAEWMVKLLGFEDFDWGGSSGIGGAEFDDLIGGIGDTEDGLNSATEAAKKLKTHLLGIDELNVVNNDESSGSGSIIGGLGGSAGLLEGALDKILEEYQTAWDEAFANMEMRFDEFANRIEEIYTNSGLLGVGEYFSKKLTEALRKIKWESVYKGAETFGTGLANFLNGLITPELFGVVGSTIASSLNTALHVLNTFGETFEWEEFGYSLSTGLKKFLETWDAELTTETFSQFCTGFIETLTGVFDGAREEKLFNQVGQKIVDVICGIEWGTLIWDLGGLVVSFAKALIRAPFDLISGVLEGSTKQMSQYMMDAIFGEGKFEIDWSGFSFKEEFMKAFGIDKISDGFFNLGTEFFEIESRINAASCVDVQSFSDVFNQIGTLIDTWWSNNISPYFNSEMWYTLAEGIRLGLEMKWAEITGWWQNTAIYIWWTEDIEPWFSVEKWTGLLNNIKISFKTKWDETANQWKTNIKKWWDEHVEPWFTKEKWLKLGENLKNGIFEGFKGIVNKVIGILNDVISALEGLVNKAINGINSLLSELGLSQLSIFAGFEGTIDNVLFDRIHEFAKGGIVDKPTLGIFGEQGREAIVPLERNTEWIDSIAEQINNTGNNYSEELLREQNALLREQNELLSYLANKEIVASIDPTRETVRGLREAAMRYGFSFT